ncbi:hypothetical protein [Corynebacterium halotolerans]|uniref:Uncharacterized protein n=1 Tax=Corynebacterium halotolerans YIM 70093 = DSM 44683 TaxID=1121362 RepID=M1MVH5_9CORY|nr:hypothetical protein [Corynebacterium halotolerans]AGF71729.1 hypothetical protein A605_03590 [Corynebacterium halotolerans YIM 70093 = DSM 44683]
MNHPETPDTDPLVDALHAPDTAAGLDPAVADALRYTWSSDDDRDEFLTDLFSGDDPDLYPPTIPLESVTCTPSPLR